MHILGIAGAEWHGNIKILRSGKKNSVAKQQPKIYIKNITYSKNYTIK